MKLTVFSYRYAQEILEHANNREAWDEIISATESAPLFVHAGKSKSNPRLDVVQQLMNTWFDRALGVDRGWDYHPLATAIPNSGLAVDFRKVFPNIIVQAEIQFGNMSRWYSDVFKFQTAYSQSLINVGLCVVPMGILARRIDSNIVSFERVARELPSAEMSLTLPILVIGVEPDERTPIIDVRRAGISLDKLVKADKKTKQTEPNRYRLINAVVAGQDISGVSTNSPTGLMAKAQVSGIEDDEI